MSLHRLTPITVGVPNVEETAGSDVAATLRAAAAGGLDS
jgi:hypothetical protein